MKFGTDITSAQHHRVSIVIISMLTLEFSSKHLCMPKHSLKELLLALSKRQLLYQAKPFLTEYYQREMEKTGDFILHNM